jgi:hypothetical protein
MDEKIKEYKRRYYEKNKKKILAKQKDKKFKEDEPNRFWVERRVILVEW